MLTVSFASCANMDKYKDNLGSDYKIETADDDEMEAFLALMGVDADDYEVEELVYAVNEDDFSSVMIIKCKKMSGAKDLAEEFEKIAEDSDEGEIVRKGSFVLVGDEDAVKDALGK